MNVNTSNNHSKNRSENIPVQQLTNNMDDMKGSATLNINRYNMVFAQTQNNKDL